MFDAKKMGEQISYIRTKNKYTQEQLAEKLKVSPQAISKWENGKAVPEITLLCEMSKIFNCSVDRILDLSSCVLRNMGFNYEFIVMLLPVIFDVLFMFVCLPSSGFIERRLLTCFVQFLP